MESRFVAIPLGRCSFQLGGGEVWVELAIRSVGDEGTWGRGGTGEFGAKPAGAWSPDELCAHVREGEGVWGASPRRVR